MGMAFKKAEKKQAKLRLAMTGPSGSGKTYSALKIAAGIGKKIAVLDTENHSASLYADEFEFDTLEIDSPYTIQKYLDGIKAAVESGYDVLVIDSISHAWAGEGGLLEKKGALDVRGGNSYTNWAPVTKEHEAFKAALLSCDIHLIVTMRSKQDYVLEINDKGKSSPRKVGLAPIQRDGMEYEFTLVLDMGMDHTAQVSKTRVRTFDNRMFKPSQDTGHELLTWLNDGVVPQAVPVPLAVHKPAETEKVYNDAGARLITASQRARLFAILKASGRSETTLKQYLIEALGIESTKDITMDEYEEVVTWVQGDKRGME